MKIESSVTAVTTQTFLTALECVLFLPDFISYLQQFTTPT